MVVVAECAAAPCGILIWRVLNNSVHAKTSNIVEVLISTLNTLSWIGPVSLWNATLQGTLFRMAVFKVHKLGVEFHSRSLFFHLQIKWAKSLFVKLSRGNVSKQSLLKPLRPTSKLLWQLSQPLVYRYVTKLILVITMCESYFSHAHCSPKDKYAPRQKSHLYYFPTCL